MITAVRNELASLLRAQLPDMVVHQWLPEDTPELPCAVVGRPVMVPSPDAANAILATTDVSIVGRRTTNDEAQQELDATTWLALQAYRGFRGIAVAGGAQRLIVTAVDPDLVAIANEEYPIYRISVDVHLVDC